MPLKKFKLVPIKIYENMINDNQQLEKGDEVTKPPMGEESVHSKRNIRDIKDKDQNTKSNMVPSDKEFKKNIIEGGGRENPVFLPDSNTLPQFTKAANIQKSFKGAAGSKRYISVQKNYFQFFSYLYME